mgnify:CR=1 FL=1
MNELSASYMVPENKLTIGIIVEQRMLDNPWQDFAWLPVGILPGIEPIEPNASWKLLGEGKGWKHFLIGSLELELFKGETEGYRYNVSNDPAYVYVVLSPAEEIDDPEIRPFLATVCPYEAESYRENGEDVVEGVVMPDEINSWVSSFIEKYHVDQPFKKRKQKRAYDPRKTGFMRNQSTLK